MKCSLLLLVLCTPSADAIFGYSSLIGNDNCMVGGKSVADNGLCEELNLKGTVDSTERACNLGTDTTDCSRAHSLKGWRFDCGGGHSMAFSDQGDYSSDSVTCHRAASDPAGTACGKYIWNGAALGLKGKFFGSEEKTIVIDKRVNSAAFSLWKQTLYQFEMEIPGIGTRRCHAVGTSPGGLSGRTSTNHVKMNCPKSTGSDNSYVKNGDTIIVEFGRGGDIEVINNDQTIAKGIFIKYGEDMEYTALFAPQQPAGRGDAFKNKVLHGRFTLRDQLFNDWNLPDVACTKDRAQLYTIQDLPRWQRDSANAMDACFDHKYDPCRSCTISTKGEATFSKRNCEKEGTLTASDETCKARSQLYCLTTGTCVDECTSCPDNNKSPLEGRFYHGPNTCAEAPPVNPWKRLSSEKVCGAVDTVRSEELKGKSLQECKEACEAKADCVGVDYFGKFKNCNLYTQMCTDPTKGNAEQDPESWCLRNCCRNNAGNPCEDYNYATINDKCQDTPEGPKCVGTDSSKLTVEDHCVGSLPLCHKWKINGLTTKCEKIALSSGTPCGTDSICSDGLCIGKNDVSRVCGGKQTCADVFPKLAQCDKKWKDGCDTSSVPPVGFTADMSGSELCPSVCGGVGVTRPTDPSSATTMDTPNDDEETDTANDDTDDATPMAFTSSIFIILSLLLSRA